MKLTINETADGRAFWTEPTGWTYGPVFANAEEAGAFERFLQDRHGPLKPTELELAADWVNFLNRPKRVCGRCGELFAAEKDSVLCCRCSHCDQCDADEQTLINCGQDGWLCAECMPF